MPPPPSRRGVPSPPADPGSAKGSAAVVAAGGGAGAPTNRRRSADRGISETSDAAQRAQALLLSKAPDEDDEQPLGIWGPEGIPQPTGRRAVFEVSGLVTAPAKGFSARWSADNKVGLVCGTTIYVHSLGISHGRGGSPGVTCLPERADNLSPDLGAIPTHDFKMSAERKFQLAPLAQRRKGAGVFKGTMVNHRPSFRGLDWSPPMPACGGECLMVTCSSDHHVGVFSVPQGRKTTWHEAACLSDALEQQLKKLKYMPRETFIPGTSATNGSPMECLRKKTLLSTLSVAWSQRIGRVSRGCDDIHTWIALGGVGSLAVFTHKTAVTPKLAVDSEAAHTFECSDLVSLPGAASYVAALSWLDVGPEPCAEGVAGGCPALVSGSGNGVVVLWATNAPAGSAPDNITLTPLQLICTADNSPVLSLLPAPWISPQHNSPDNSARLAVAKGTGIWIWEHGGDPWGTESDLVAPGTKRSRTTIDGDTHTDGKRATANSTSTAIVDSSRTVGHVYLLPKVGTAIVSGIAWARDLSPIKREATQENGRLERVLLFVSSVESRIYGYEGPWSNAHRGDAMSRLVPSKSDMFREQPVDAESVWGVAGSPNALVCAVLVRNADVRKFSASAASMFTSHKARVSYSLRPGLCAGHVVEYLAAKLETLKSNGATSGLTPTELWEFAECCVAYAADPTAALANATARVDHGLHANLSLKIRRALERAVYERRLSSCNMQHLLNVSRGIDKVYTPAAFAGHHPAGEPQASMFAQHEFAMRRAHVMQTMQALQTLRPTDLEPQMRRAAWRMVLWSEQAQKAPAGSNEVSSDLNELAAALRKTLTVGMSSDAAAAEERATQEVCPACQGTLAATGLVFASCASNHRWRRCCYSLELLSLQKAEPGGWLRSSIWPSCTARAAVAWSLSALLGQPAPLCPATATVMMPARGTL